MSIGQIRFGVTEDKNGQFVPLIQIVSPRFGGQEISFHCNRAFKDVDTARTFIMECNSVLAGPRKNLKYNRGGKG